ncbi:heavy metal translocating P-type ATPase [Anaerotalea alkaliphila]|uniref:Cd(2+)-exporting ATPase n=1 Tax=Anaerotalea alkaliphila TaxID=2662126 RepID=A0A7X5KMW8_9FIRM|nr:heavy metal translocating P-type ATPase [Anaerotalea alkaliphila]NDL67409.1 heavy metal translocating P-type ATPase [Anaerotalea alkaliphila]
MDRNQRTELVLEGLDCAHCAVKIEEKAKGLEGVRMASLNFATKKLVIEADGEGLLEGLVAQASAIVKELEPHVQVRDAAEGRRSGEPSDTSLGWKRFLAGVLLFVWAVLWKEGVGGMDPGFRGGIPLLAVFLGAYFLLGQEILGTALGNLRKGRVFDENFLMSIATLGAFLIGEYPEAVAVMLFYRIGEWFQDRAVNHSRRSIAKLMDIKPEVAWLQEEGGFRKVDPRTVDVGARILVKPGERVPLDGSVLSPRGEVDTSALTGESMPRALVGGDLVLSGSINLDAPLEVEVVKSYGDSTVQKVLELVENAAGNKAKTEQFITRFAKVYTPAVVGTAALLAVLPPLFLGMEAGHSPQLFGEWFRRSLIFLVVSCPCALVVSIPLGFFGGIGAASRHGILIKGGQFLEALHGVRHIAFDKTGTLTEGKFSVEEVHGGLEWDRGSLLRLAASAEAYSNHPIAKSIQEAYGSPELDPVTLLKEIPGSGLKASRRGPLGEEVLHLGHGGWFQELGIRIPPQQDSKREDGARTRLHMALQGEWIGTVVLGDKVKEGARDMVQALRKEGIRTSMLSGDHPEVAAQVGKEIGVDEVYGGLLPQGKLERLERILKDRKGSGAVAFVGDGINDAAVLARADVGIAMGGRGQDVAIESADVVLMTDEPQKVLQAIRIARRTRGIVWQNIGFALGVKGLVLLLGAFGFAGMWEAVFADVGVALLAVLNAMRVMK